MDEHAVDDGLPRELPVVRGEPRMPVAVTMAVVIVLPLLLPATLLPVPRWVAPVVFLGFAVALLALDPGRIDRRSQTVHAVRVAYVVVLSGFVIFATLELTVALVEGKAGITDSAGNLLEVGGIVWLALAITFAFLYWELDLGGPGSGRTASGGTPTSPSPRRRAQASAGRTGDRPSSTTCISV